MLLGDLPTSFIFFFNLTSEAKAAIEVAAPAISPTLPIKSPIGS